MRAVSAAVLLLCWCGSVAGFESSFSQFREETVERQAKPDKRRLQNTVNSSSEKKEKNKDDPLGALALGLALWCFIPCVIWNNERIAIKQYKLQLKAQRWAIHIDEVSKEPMKDMCGRIVYLSGKSTCDGVELTDKIFTKVKSKGKIKLRRVVEMWQWKEEEDKDDKGNRRGWKYSAQWSDAPLECKGERSNPPMPFSSTRRQEPYRAWLSSGSGDACAEAEHSDVKVGAYYLGEYVIRELQRWVPKDVEDSQLVPSKAAECHPFSACKPQLREGYWYWGNQAPQIGDVRVRFEELEPGPISICGVLTKTRSGHTFLPVLHADSKLEDAVVECGGGMNCCLHGLRVKELHYHDNVVEEEFKEALKKRPVDLTKKQKKGHGELQDFGYVELQDSDNSSAHGADVDLDDLCCVGPFGEAVVKLMHWIGLEEEFLGVREADVSLETMMKKEGSDAANRHHMCRLVCLLLLILGSFFIISPITSLLNANWLVAAFGGAMISAVLCCGAFLFSTAAYCCIMSSAWLFYRPILAVFGFACVAACMFVTCAYGDEMYGRAHGAAP